MLLVATLKIRQTLCRNMTKGFTLIETLIAAFVLTIAVLTTAFSVLNLQDLSALAREKETAMNDASRVLEAMRDTADNSLATLRSTDWSAWMTNNVMNVKAQNELRLDQENVVVNVGNGNPASVTFVLNWNHKQRSYSYRVMTLMTDRA